MTKYDMQLPLKKDDLARLVAGDEVRLTGKMFTLRDAGHIRLMDELFGEGGALFEVPAASAGVFSGVPESPAGVPSEAAQPSSTPTGDSGTPENCKTINNKKNTTSLPSLPYGLDGATIFYAGPTPATPTRPFGAIGPTTASRMDFAAPSLYAAGIVATIGKGKRSRTVIEACKTYGCVYFAAVGGVAAMLASHVASARVVAYDDLGTEALREIEVKNFPVYVEIDTHGNDLYAQVEATPAQ